MCLRTEKYGSFYLNMEEKYRSHLIWRRQDLWRLYSDRLLKEASFLNPEDGYVRSNINDIDESECVVHIFHLIYSSSI